MRITDECIKKMYNRGMEIGLFYTSELGKIANTCYKESKIKVIDYDKVKEEVQEKHTRGLKTVKSCDALKLIEEHIDLIEMKSLENFLNNRNEISEQKMLDKDYCGKFTDSIMVMQLLLRISDMQITNVETKKIMESLRYYIVLVDIELGTYEEFLTRMEFLADPERDKERKCLEKICNKIEDDLGKIGKRWEIESRLMSNTQLNELYLYG